jgi:hypothetical protein
MLCEQDPDYFEYSENIENSSAKHKIVSQKDSAPRLRGLRARRLPDTQTENDEDYTSPSESSIPALRLVRTKSLSLPASLPSSESLLSDSSASLSSLSSCSMAREKLPFTFDLSPLTIDSPSSGSPVFSFRQTNLLLHDDSNNAQEAFNFPAHSKTHHAHHRHHYHRSSLVIHVQAPADLDTSFASTSHIDRVLRYTF